MAENLLSGPLSWVAKQNLSIQNKESEIWRKLYHVKTQGKGKYSTQGILSLIPFKQSQSILKWIPAMQRRHVKGSEWTGSHLKYPWEQKVRNDGFIRWRQLTSLWPTPRQISIARHMWQQTVKIKKELKNMFYESYRYVFNMYLTTTIVHIQLIWFHFRVLPFAHQVCSSNSSFCDVILNGKEVSQPWGSLQNKSHKIKS